MKKIFTLILTTLLLGTGSVWADDLVISSVSDWSTFAKSVTNGTNYSGQTVKLAADLVMGSQGSFASDYMVGSNETNSFQGIFDGQGHTITINKTGVKLYGDNFAPFRHVKNATIKNLKTEGALDIYSKVTDDYNYENTKVAGIVGTIYGTTTISNCSSSMKLSRTKDGGITTGEETNDATIGGIVAYVAASATAMITNVIYDGEIVANKGISGIVGYVKEGSTDAPTTCTISNTLFAGKLTYTTDSNIRNIYRAGTGEGKITVTASTNVYRVTSFNSTASGTEATAQLLNSGQLAWTLNYGNTETLFWGQANVNASNIAAYPTLTITTTEKVVRMKAKNTGTFVYGNLGGHVPNAVRLQATGWKTAESGVPIMNNIPTDLSESSTGDDSKSFAEIYRTAGGYKLHVTAAGATTLVLPYDATWEDGNLKAYNLVWEGSTLKATSVSEITADKPVLINAPAGDYLFTRKEGSDLISNYSSRTPSNGPLTGVYNEAGSSSAYNPLSYVPANSYVLQDGKDGLGFYKVDEDNKIKITSFRAYLTIEGSAGSRGFIGIEDGTTGIQEAIATLDTANGDNTIYDLSGRVVTNPKKGIYIKNGKKFFVK